MKIEIAKLASDVLPRDWTMRRGDWIRVEDGIVVEVNPGAAGNAKFWGVCFLAYGTSPYVYSTEFHGSNMEHLEAYVRSLGEGYRPQIYYLTEKDWNRLHATPPHHQR